MIQNPESRWREVLHLEVPGQPVGAARPRVVRTRSGASHTYMPDSSTRQEGAILHLARLRWGARAPLDGIVRVEVVAVLERPRKLVPRANGGTLTGPAGVRLLGAVGTVTGRVPCPTKPDGDNVLKLAMDALVKARVLEGDERVTECECRKVWAAIGEGPSTVVTVYAGPGGRWW